MTPPNKTPLTCETSSNAQQDMAASRIQTSSSQLNTLDRPYPVPSIAQANGALPFAIVAQGGGQRGIFTAGVLDAFLEQSFDPFSCYIGVSAGALNLSSYISRQSGFAYRFIAELTAHDQFFNLFRFVRRQQGMDLDWALTQALGEGDLKLDLAAGMKTLSMGKEALACVTHVGELRDHYLPMFSDDWLSVAKATCAIPLLFNDEVIFNGERWVDGGVSAAIPAEEAWRRGYQNIVVIRTEEIADNGCCVQPVTSHDLEYQRLHMEKQLPAYLKRLNLEEQYHALNGFHQRLSEKFTEISQEWREAVSIDSVVDRWHHIVADTKKKQRDVRWLFGGNRFYRLQAMHNKGSSSESMELLDMLVAHYRNTRHCESFLETPPEGANIVQIAPCRELKSSALLSKPEELHEDYLQGIEMGRAFIANWKEGALQPPHKIA
uniref:patatin-like phospholipase family protein n=1 Tax=Thaumasiovibrio occultus TaxID=1891184 RepID=UPI00131A7DE4|nr:patatin-like phospholipase family protein [Thaumasiovibrio occultus]